MRWPCKHACSGSSSTGARPTPSHITGTAQRQILSRFDTRPHQTRQRLVRPTETRLITHANPTVARRQACATTAVSPWSASQPGGPAQSTPIGTNGPSQPPSTSAPLSSGDTPPQSPRRLATSGQQTTQHVVAPPSRSGVDSLSGAFSPASTPPLSAAAAAAAARACLCLWERYA